MTTESDGYSIGHTNQQGLLVEAILLSMSDPNERSRTTRAQRELPKAARTHYVVPVGRYEDRTPCIRLLYFIAYTCWGDTIHTWVAKVGFVYMDGLFFLHKMLHELPLLV